MLSDEEVEKHRKWALNPDNYTVTTDAGVSIVHGFQLAIETIYPIFSEMRWAFFRAPKGIEFITSDCPVPGTTRHRVLPPTAVTASGCEMWR
jgi:hypothetical protein